jgi:transketolase
MKNNIIALCKKVRYWSVKLPTLAGSGHPTSSSSAVELMTALMFGNWFNYNINQPQAINNDQLIFSKGHASSLFYSLWHAAGAVSEKELITYRQFGSKLEGHPVKRFPYTVAATGSLGQGLAIGLGMALSSRQRNIKNKIYVLLGDGELAEGSVWEAVQLADHYKANNLVAIVDVNGLGQTGKTINGHDLKAIGKKLSAFNWQVYYINNGHDLTEIKKVYKLAFKNQKKPIAIIAKTVKGYGLGNIAGKNNWHGKPLSIEQWLDVEKELIPSQQKVVGRIKKPGKCIFSPKTKQLLIRKIKTDKAMPVRFAASQVLATVANKQQLVFLDADTGNSTGLDCCKPKAGKRYLSIFIAEQTMAGVALGFSLSNIKPVSATFGAFWTRAFDQLRMASYNQANMLCLGTHSGVAIGQDGGSQMGLEDIAMFRSLLGSSVWQPADDVSAQAIIQLALINSGINYIRCARQHTSRIYSYKEKFKLGELKILRPIVYGQPVIIASGTTVAEAIKAVDELMAIGIKVGVVDVYCLKPAPDKQLKAIAEKASSMLVVEDHYLAGGLSEIIGQIVNCPIYSLAVSFAPCSGKKEELLAYEKIDAKAIVEKIKILTK